jgi:hypothetical protein
MPTLASSALHTSTGSPSSPITITDALTVSSGTNRYLLVMIGSYMEAGSLPTITAVTWDYGSTNQALSALNSTNAFAGAQESPLDMAIAAWGVVAPATGQLDLRVTFTGAPPTIWVCVQEWTGVDQTTPYRAIPAFLDNYAGDTTPDVTVSASQNGDTVVDCISYFSGPSSTTNTVIREVDTTDGYSFGTSYATATGSNHVIGWTITNGYSASNAVALVPGAAAAGIVKQAAAYYRMMRNR